jgi:hypothetical protein
LSGGVAQAVEHLTSKFEVVSSNPSTTEKVVAKLFQIFIIIMFSEFQKLSD